MLLWIPGEAKAIAASLWNFVVVVSRLHLRRRFQPYGILASLRIPVSLPPYLWST